MDVGIVEKKERHQLRWTAKGIECRIDVTMKWYALRTNDRREKTKLAAVCRCIFSKSNDSKSFNAIGDAKPFTNWSIVKAQIITRKLLISSGLVACQMLMLMLADFGHQTIFFPSCFILNAFHATFVIKFIWRMCSPACKCHIDYSFSYVPFSLPIIFVTFLNS